MKRECYFYPGHGDEDHQRLTDDLKAFERHPEKRSRMIGAGAVLLVIDMQRYFLKSDSHAFLPSAPAILPRIISIIDAFRTASLPVLFTRHGNRLDETGPMMSWWGGVLETGGSDWPLTEEVAETCRAGEVIDKGSYDAFHETNLQERLSKAGVNEVHVCGVMTHLCCETTARAAFVRGYNVAVAADATATYNYDLHLGSLRGLAQGVARITWSSEYRD